MRFFFLYFWVKKIMTMGGALPRKLRKTPKIHDIRLFTIDTSESIFFFSRSGTEVGKTFDIFWPEKNSYICVSEDPAVLCTHVFFDRNFCSTWEKNIIVLTFFSPKCVCSIKVCFYFRLKCVSTKIAGNDIFFPEKFSIFFCLTLENVFVKYDGNHTLVPKTFLDKNCWLEADGYWQGWEIW